MTIQKKKIKDFENYYIYSDGRVQNCNTNHFLKYTSDKSGYLKVRLYKDKHQHTLLVHRSECNGGDYYSYCSQNSTEAISNQKV